MFNTVIPNAMIPELLINDTPFIDTRAPIEFGKGAFPTSVNLPLMSDDEREQVGIKYKQQGQQAAMQLGHSLVSGELKAQRIQQWCEFLEKHDNAVVYCWRGGLRSDIVCRWLADHGVQAPKIAGGYKAIRRVILDTTEHTATHHPMLVVTGQTGSGKTHILPKLAASIDLEQMANHRGSAFGKRPSGQPTQLQFENALGIALLKHAQKNVKRLIVEDEGSFIGSCSLPPVLHRRIQSSPCAEIVTSFDERVEQIYQDYIVGLHQEYLASHGPTGFELFAFALQNSLQKIRKRLGHELYTDISQQLSDALDNMRTHATPDKHRLWISTLLHKYYDPMYEYHLNKLDRRIQFRGNKRDVIDWLTHKTEG